MKKISSYLRAYSLVAIYIAMIFIGMLLATKAILVLGNPINASNIPILPVYTTLFGIIGTLTLIVCVVLLLKFLMEFSRGQKFFGAVMIKFLAISLLTGFSGGIVASSISGFITLLY